jgi:hypothetical protein
MSNDVPQGFLSLKGIRLGQTSTISDPHPEIFLCPEDLSYFSGNLSISGALTASSITIENTSISDLHIPIGIPNNAHISLSRPIPLFNTNYTNTIGLNLSNQTHGTEAFQLMDKYLSTYLYEVPPAPTLGTSSATSNTLTIGWTVTPTIPSAFLPISLPYIRDIRIDFILSTDNSGKSFIGTSMTTINLGSTSANSSIFFVSGSDNGLSGNTYNYHNILSDTFYDFRVYQINYGGAPYTATPWKYLNFFDYKTTSVGVPDIVIGITINSIGTTSDTTNWTAPVIHDLTSGNTSLPVISRYSVHTIPISTTRYGGLFNSTINSSYTLVTSNPVNSNTNLVVTSLLPGTTFNVTVAAKNEVNPNYGTTSSFASFVTLTPSSPAILLTSNCGSLLSPTVYPLAGASFTGVVFSEPIVQYNTAIRTVNSPSIRINQYPGAIGTSIASVSASAGQLPTLSNAVLTIGGFPTSNNISGTVTNGSSSLVYTGAVDVYSSSSAGFWMTEQFYVQGNSPSTNYPGSPTQYRFNLTFTPTGNSPTTTNPVVFYVDTLLTVPSVVGPRLLSETSNVWEYISGIPSWQSGAVFNYQIEMTEIADYFLRADRKHTTVSVIDAVTPGVSYSTPSVITQPDIGVSKYYYIGTSDNTVTSTTLFNTAGLLLTSNAGAVQFKDFSVTLNNVSSGVYSENITLQGYGFNLFGTSLAGTGGYIGKTLRVDTNSINNTGKVKQVTSGTGQYPNITGGAGQVYSHSDSIIGTEELQLVDGKYRTRSSGGYANYTIYYFSGSPVLRDYTSVLTETTSYRYVTFKYTGADIGIPIGETREKIRVIINSMSGLTVNMTTPNTENHRFQVRVVDVGDGTNQNDTTTLGWMDMCNPISPVGLQFGADGTGCLNQSTSTNSQRDASLRNGTTRTAEIYFRIGIQADVSASFSNLTISTVLSFT